MEDYSDAIPVELWHMVFSMLSFEDLKNCRLVCKHWLELVKSLREFRSKNCLRLDFDALSENEPPLTVLQDSSVKFSGMIVGYEIRIEFSPNLSMRLAQIGETVTYLDLRYLKDRVLRLFVENLSLFKVLNQLKLCYMSSLLDAAFKERTFNKLLQRVLKKLLTKHDWNVITKEDVQEYFKNENLEEFLEKAALEGYKDVVVEEVTKNLKRLNLTGDKSRSIREVTNLIANKLRDLEKIKLNTNLCGSRNESVRILTILSIFNDYIRTPSIDDLGLILQLLPNLQEFQILDSVFYDDKLSLEFIEVYLDKTTEYSVSFDFNLNICSLPSLPGLKSLKLENDGDDHDEPANLDVTNLLEKYPTLNSIGLKNFSLPQDNFHYFTDFTLDLSLVSTLDLTNLCLFKNLSYLELYDNGIPTQCFVNHHPFTLESMKTFIFNIGTSGYCQGCLSTLLKAFSNLSDLDFTGKSEDVDSIFQYQANLIKLRITVKLLKIENTDWPEMKRLRSLILFCDEIVGEKDDWDRFTKKLDRLKNFIIDSGCCLDVEKILETVNMPWLQQVKFYKKHVPHKEIDVRNRGKVLVKFHPRANEDGDDEPAKKIKLCSSKN